MSLSETVKKLMLNIFSLVHRISTNQFRYKFSGQQRQVNGHQKDLFSAKDSLPGLSIKTTLLSVIVVCMLVPN